MRRWLTSALVLSGLALFGLWSARPQIQDPQRVEAIQTEVLGRWALYQKLPEGENGYIALETVWGQPGVADVEDEVLADLTTLVAFSQISLSKTQVGLRSPSGEKALL